MTNSQMTTSRVYTCPRCGKRRLHIENQYDEQGNVIPWEPSGETVKNTVNGKEIEHERFEDICTRCQQNIIKRFYKPGEKDVEAVLKALQGDGALPEGTSLEDLL